MQSKLDQSSLWDTVLIRRKEILECNSTAYGETDFAKSKSRCTWNKNKLNNTDIESSTFRSRRTYLKNLRFESMHPRSKTVLASEQYLSTPPNLRKSLRLASPLSWFWKNYFEKCYNPIQWDRTFKLELAASTKVPHFDGWGIEDDRSPVINDCTA